jgi:uncharacterized protein with HEPN domain
MADDDLLYFMHMLEMARKAVTKTEGIGRDAYDGDENLRPALVHPVQIIGEAARYVSAETCAVYPEIPWREIIGMRHRIVHDYMSADEDIRWVVVTKDFPSLIGSLEEVIPNQESTRDDKYRSL